MFEGLLSFPNLANHLTQIGVYCILALSLNLINGSLGTFSLGHNGFWGMGAYAAAVVVWSFGSADGGLLVFVASFGAAMLASALFGLLVGAPCLRLKGDYLAIATLGFSEIFIICVRNSESWRMFGERGLGGAAGFSTATGFHGGNDVMASLVHGSNNGRWAIYLVLTWILVAVTFVLIRNLINSGHGRAIQAIRDDETAAELIGVNLIRYKVLVFVIGAALAGMAGAITANCYSQVSPNGFLMMKGITVLLMVVLGGLGSMSGSIIAVFVLYTAEQALGTIDIRWPAPVFSNNEFSLTYKAVKDLWQVIFPLVLIVLMLRWPRGITRGRELSRSFFGDWIEERRATLRLWVQNPIPILIACVQWGQILWALPASERMFENTGARLAFLAASVAIFVAGQKMRRVYWARHQSALFNVEGAQA